MGPCIEDKDKWRNYLAKHNISGNELIVDRNTLADYNLLIVPRMILINNDFTIEQLYAPGPGDKRLKNIFKYNDSTQIVIC